MSADIDNLISELKETQLDYLYISRNLEKCDITKLFESLKETKVTSLILIRLVQIDEVLEALTRYLKDTIVTHLSFSTVHPIDREHISEFFNALKFTKITHFKLCYSGLEIQDIIVSLSQVLKHTKIQNLDLSYNDLSNHFIEFLPGLKESSVTTLRIEEIGINDETFHRFVEHLKFTKIKTLILKKNRITENGMIYLAKNLTGTKVVSLNVSENNITEKALQALIKNLKDTNIVELKLGYHKKVVNKISQYIRDSAIKKLQITFDGMQSNEIKTVFSTPQLIKPKYLFLKSFSVECQKLPATIKLSGITHLDLSMTNPLSLKDIQFLFEGLKDSFVEFLSLSYVYCGSSGLDILSKYIKYTKIVELDLSFISDPDTGCLSDTSIETFMKALNESRVAYLVMADNIYNFKKFISLIKETRLIRLHIDYPDKDQLQHLLDSIESSQLSYLMFSYIDSLKEFEGPNLHSFLYFFDGQEMYFKIAKILCSNEQRAREVVKVFQKVVVEGEQNSLHFGSSNELVKDGFIDNCLILLKQIKTTPGIISHIIVDDGIRFAKEEIIKFLSNIHENFVLFAVFKFSDNVNQIVEVLEKCELIGLEETVQSLLLHRPVFVIENNLGILHPFVYLCLHKYNMLMYSPELEPDKKDVIIDYFQKYSEIKDGQNVVTLLKGE